MNRVSQKIIRDEGRELLQATVCEILKEDERLERKMWKEISRDMAREYEKFKL